MDEGRKGEAKTRILLISLNFYLASEASGWVYDDLMWPEALIPMFVLARWQGGTQPDLAEEDVHILKEISERKKIEV